MCARLWRCLLAQTLRDLGDRFGPDTRQWRDEEDAVLRELGRWAYDGHAWTSVRVMLKTALRRAKTDESWQRSMS